MTATDKLYDFLVGNKSGQRVSKGIREDAVPAVPGNFIRFLAANLCTKTGDALSKPGVILTWMLGTLGAPSALIGLVVPVREAGSLLLQIFVGEWVGRYRIRKWFWVAGSFFQGAAILGMVPVALFLEGAAAGWAVVGLIAVFSLARGVCSVLSKDITGRTIPKTRRGRLSGIAASASGVVSIGLGIWFLFYRGEQLSPVAFAGILGVAGLLWWIAAAVMASLVEKPAEPGEKKNPFREIRDSIGLLKTDPEFRLFCIARGLLAGTVLSMPFYVILAREATDGRTGSLGILLIGGSVATAISGGVWGRFADRSSRQVLATAGIVAGMIGCVTALLGGLEFSGIGGSIFWGVLFFLIGLAHTGIRQGRKTQLVDMADADNRARMVAVSNTLIGVVVLSGSAIGLLADLIGERWVIFIFALPGLAGGLLALKLPEVQKS